MKFEKDFTDFKIHMNRTGGFGGLGGVVESYRLDDLRFQSWKR
jgi:hypothetical protein